VTPLGGSSAPSRFGPRRAAGKIARLIESATVDVLRRRRDARVATHGKDDPGASPRVFSLPAVSSAEHALLLSLADHYCQNRFDVLGSGWADACYGAPAAGFEGHRFPSGPAVDADRDGRWLEGRVTEANLGHSQSLWRLTSADYRPIDWHRDLRSGFRWPETAWHKDIAYGRSPGADIKVPWELARFQHGPALALAAALDSSRASRCAAAFRNQVLDFIAANPPRFGVNWASPMDVSLRAVSWLATRDLFAAAGVTFDEDFAAAWRKSLLAHGRHIAAHLECEGLFRGNHYLSNVAGLLFLGACLPRTPETDAWLAFGVQELIGETQSEFNPDGSNFEASTSYHRLSAEMVLYATALALALPEEKRAALGEARPENFRGRRALRPGPRPSYPLPGGGESPFPSSHWARLDGMAAFVRAVTKPHGRVAQIGDNDSGRFLKIDAPLVSVAGATPRENILDHRSLAAALDALLGRGFLPTAGRDASVIDALLQGRDRPRVEPSVVPEAAGDPGEWDKFQALFARLPADRKRVETFSWADAKDPRRAAFADFGLYIFRTDRAYLAVRCGPVGQRGCGGHAHNDQLSFELTVDGRDIVRDPGSYVYTALPEKRNAYRSVRAHAAPQWGDREPGRLDMGLFRLSPEGEGRCLYFGPKGFVGTHRGFGPAVLRAFEITPGALRVVDICPDRPFPPAAPLDVPYSPAYGVLEKP